MIATSEPLFIFALPVASAGACSSLSSSSLVGVRTSGSCWWVGGWGGCGEGVEVREKREDKGKAIETPMAFPFSLALFLFLILVVYKPTNLVSAQRTISPRAAGRERRRDAALLLRRESPRRGSFAAAAGHRKSFFLVSKPSEAASSTLSARNSESPAGRNCCRRRPRALGKGSLPLQCRRWRWRSRRLRPRSRRSRSW